jgi:hypothetical protein
MKTLVCFALLSVCCSAQSANPSDLQTVGGFLDFCGLKDGQISKRSLEKTKAAPPEKVVEAIQQSMRDSVADKALCLGYLNGLVEGWKEGHEHGVLAARFPAGVPKPEEMDKALKTLSAEQLKADVAGMSNDVPCLPEHLTFGDLNDAVVKGLHERADKSPFARIFLTSRTVPQVLQDAFPCPAPQPVKAASGSST